MEKRRKCWKCDGSGFYSKKARPEVQLKCRVCVKSIADEQLATPSPELLEQRKNFHIGIIGAGIGGLGLALGLGRIGFRVTVYDRDGTFNERKQGYGLTLQQGLHAMKFFQLDIPKDTPSTSHFAFDPNGRILGYFGSEFSEFFEKKDAYSKKTKGKFSGEGKYNVHIPRQHLRFMLWDAIRRENLENVQVEWGYKAVDVSCETPHDTIRVGLRNHAELGVIYKTHNMVVGADGIFSSTRELLLGDTLNFLGCVVVLGIAPIRHPLTHQRVCETMDGVTRIYSMPFTSTEGVGIETDPSLQGKDSIMWQLSFPVDSLDEAREICRSGETLKVEALRRCGSWHAPIPDMLQATSQNLISGHPVYDRPELDPGLLKTEKDKRNLGDLITLLGDAAHPMTPFKGQGANQALLDSRDLVALLESREFFQRRQECLDLFEAGMCKRSAPKVNGSRVAAKLLHTALATKPHEEDKSSDPLVKAGISALTPENLNKKIIAAAGYGHRPHTLHQHKIDLSRQA
eukprot:CAMPEP_0203785454 /NCGR_PEP_ID=MMETSP0100_2-20121128/1042_1 /ASSEMBLY_ACC=CAM_ASM_000210 /TAXON_ID=96639 /ORGANISM=" , Strain NY0313808BC1" /LENGTH=514 /DNA_ID=CAMNT_0050687571 /DNA_START=533 /DNA_END=2074 /DNA_ORIENTATION=+